MEYALKKSQGLFYFPRLYLQCQKQNYYVSTKMLEELFKINLINNKKSFIIFIFIFIELLIGRGFYNTLGHPIGKLTWSTLIHVV
jgi:hypothetical protein